MRILLALDGSEFSLKAAQYIVAHRDAFRRKLQPTLLYVDAPFVERAETVYGRGGVEREHEQNAQAAFAGAIAVLEGAGVRYETRMLVGDPGLAIAGHARDGGYDMIVMGSHGHGALSGLVLGSAVTKVLAACKVPVLVVR